MVVVTRDVGVEHEVQLEDLLGVAVTLEVEAIFQLLGRNQGVVAGVDHGGQGFLGGGIVALPDEGLALDGVGESLGDLDGAVLVVRTLAVLDVRHGLVAVLDDEVEHLGLGSGVARLLGSVEHVVHDGRGAPTECEVQVGECAEDLGLGDHALRGGGHAALGQTVLEMVDREVGGVDGGIQAAVGAAHDAVGGEVTERVEFVLVGVVGLVVAGRVHVVTHVVPQGDDPVVVVARGHVVGRDGLVGCDERLLGILIGLIEVLERDDALLGDVQETLVTTREQEETANGKRKQYLFHNTCLLAIRTKG